MARSQKVVALMRKDRDAGDHAADETDEDRDGGEERKGDEGGENAGSDKFAAGVGAHVARMASTVR